MRKIFVAGLILLAIVGSAIAEPGNGNGNGNVQGGQDNPGNSGNAPGQQTGDNQGNGQGGNPDNGNNGSNGGDQGNAGGNGGDDQSGDDEDAGEDSDDSSDGGQDQVDDQEENDQGGDDQGDNAGDSDNGGQDQGNDEDVGGDDQGNNDLGGNQEENQAEDGLVNDLINDDGQVIPHDEDLLRIALRELAHPAPGPTCRLVLEANLTRAVIKNECAAPADIGSMVLSQAEHIVIGETPEGRYILGPGQSYEIPIEAHVGTLRLTGVGGYGEYAVCEVTA